VNTDPQNQLSSNQPLFQSSPLSDLDPEVVKDLVTYAKAITDLEKFTQELTKEFGDDAKPYAKALFNKAQQKLKKVPKTPTEIRESIDPEKNLSGKTIRNMVRGYLTMGVDEKEVLDRVHQELQKVWADLSLDDVRETFVNYGKGKLPSSEELHGKLNKLRALKVSEIKLAALKVRLTPNDDEICSLEAEIDKTYKEIGVPRVSEYGKIKRLNFNISRFTLAIREFFLKAGGIRKNKLPNELGQSGYAMDLFINVHDELNAFRSSLKFGNEFPTGQPSRDESDQTCRKPFTVTSLSNYIDAMRNFAKAFERLSDVLEIEERDGSPDMSTLLFFETACDVFSIAVSEFSIEHYNVHIDVLNNNKDNIYYSWQAQLYEERPATAENTARASEYRQKAAQKVRDNKALTALEETVRTMGEVLENRAKTARTRCSEMIEIYLYPRNMQTRL